MVGNNPLVIAVPRENGEHMALDMAMSQYSMGKLGILRKAGEVAEFVAGLDVKGEMTRDAGAVIDGGSAMPIGYWKGTGLAMMLDVVAAGVSGGLTTGEVGREPWERRVSQVFVAIDVRKVGVDAGAVAERVVLGLEGTRGRSEVSGGGSDASTAGEYGAWCEGGSGGVGGGFADGVKGRFTQIIQRLGR